MRDWYRNGYFKPNLPVRQGKSNAPFVQLAALFPDLRRAFQGRPQMPQQHTNSQQGGQQQQQQQQMRLRQQQQQQQQKNATATIATATIATAAIATATTIAATTIAATAVATAATAGTENVANSVSERRSDFVLKQKGNAWRLSELKRSEEKRLKGGKRRSRKEPRGKSREN